MLRRRGHSRDAELLESCADEISQAEPVRALLTWLSESDCLLKSGYKTEYFRSRFGEWEAQGLAEKRGRRRYYRDIVCPQRKHASVARLHGLRGESAA